MRVNRRNIIEMSLQRPLGTLARQKQVEPDYVQLVRCAINYSAHREIHWLAGSPLIMNRL